MAHAQEHYAQEHLDRGSDHLGIQVYPAFDSPDTPVVLIFPAMGTPARYYRPLAQALEAAGHGVAVVDLRGNGASTPRPSRRSSYGYAELTDDVGAVLAALAPRTAGRRVLLLGHSLGGQVCVMHLAGHPEARVDGLVLVAVALPYFRAYPAPRSVGVWGGSQGIGGTSALLGVWPGWGFGGRQSARVMMDWAYSARTGRFPHVSDEEIAAVRVPVLAVSVPRDTLTPAPVMDYTCAKLRGAPLTRVHLDGSLDHFSWVRSPEAVLPPIASFVAGLPH